MDLLLGKVARCAGARFLLFAEMCGPTFFACCWMPTEFGSG